MSESESPCVPDMDETMYALVRPLLPVFRATGHSPNMLTTYSFAFGVASVWALWKERPGWFAFLFGLSYVFDCMDGEFARRYDMVTAFGDWYDHVTDWLVGLLVIAVVWIRRGHTVDRRELTVIIVLLLVTAMGMGCIQLQRRAAKNEAIDGSEALDYFTWLCVSDRLGSLLQNMGVTTLVIILTGYVYHCFRTRVALKSD